MNVSRIFGMGLAGCMAVIGLSSCKKHNFVPVQNPSLATTTQLDNYNKMSDYILKDTAYHYFGNDTLEITTKFFTNPKEYLSEINKIAKNNTPKKKIGSHMETQLIPKSGGGFMHVPVIRNEYAPVYKEQVGIIKSNKVFTTNGNDIYVPVEFYGKIND